MAVIRLPFRKLGPNVADNLLGYWVLPVGVGRNIHHHMNIEELKSVFHVDKHSDGDTGDWTVTVSGHVSVQPRRTVSAGSGSLSLSQEVMFLPIISIPSKVVCTTLASDIPVRLDTSMGEGFLWVQQENLPPKIPQYEVVRVRRAATPHLDTHNLRLRAFGQDLDLALRRTQGLFKDQLRFWTADSNSSGHVHYSLLPHEAILGCDSIRRMQFNRFPEGDFLCDPVTSETP
ncbi:hypothetical protein J6590_016878 [Homalodisca vitripennis]|nr:hypothetical protein J6590_016878 [Homalodisca vitripennis]